VGGSCPGVGSLRSEATWPARRSDIPRPLQFSVRSLLPPFLSPSLSLSLFLSSSSLFVRLPLFPLSFSHLLRVSLRSSRRHRLRPCVRFSLSLSLPCSPLSLYPSIYLFIFLLVAPAPGSRRDSPLRILDDSVVNVPPSLSPSSSRPSSSSSSSSSSSLSRYIGAHALRGRRNSQCHVSRRPVVAVSPPCSARVSARNDEQCGDCTRAPDDAELSRSSLVFGPPIWCVSVLAGVSDIILV